MWAAVSWFPILIVSLRTVHAQIVSEVNCLPQFSILSNSRGQDPCLVAAFVRGACNNGRWTVGRLPAGDSRYVGPWVEDINLCQCTTVTYDLISACAICQSKLFISWSEWAANCTADLKSIGQLRVPIPPGTSIPAWAYWDPQAHGNLFSLNALAEAQGPESSFILPTNTNTRPLDPSSSTSSQSPPTATSDSPSNGTNVGAIVGGVVGGFFVLAILGVLIFWLKRKGSRKPPSALYNGNPSMASGFIPAHPGLLTTPTSPGSIPAAWPPSPQSGYSPSPIQPYNYQDPSTRYSMNPSTNPHYSGVAELQTENYLQNRPT